MLLLGAGKLPSKWIKPLNNRLLTGPAGYSDISIAGIADRIVKLALSFLSIPATKNL